MTTLTPSVKSFTAGTSASKPVSSYNIKSMRHIRHPPTPPHSKKLEMLSYAHKIDCSRLTNVCYGSFIGSDTWKHTSTLLHQFNDSMETVHRQTVI